MWGRKHKSFDRAGGGVGERGDEEPDTCSATTPANSIEPVWQFTRTARSLGAKPCPEARRDTSARTRPRGRSFPAGAMNASSFWSHWPRLESPPLSQTPFPDRAVNGSYW